MTREGTVRLVRDLRWVWLAAATLMVGYGDLWLGGTDVAAFALTVGYLVLVPIAVMARPVGPGTAVRR